MPDKPASVWVSTIGSDATCARLDPSRPCKGFLRAFQLAQPGEQIEVTGGSYPKLSIPASATKPSDVDVVFRPALGATVTLGCDSDLTDCIELEGKHVTVKNMRTADFPPLGGMPRQGGLCICRGSDDNTLYNIDSGHLYIAGDNATVVGGDFGPTVDNVSKFEYGVGRPPVNIYVEGAFFHDHRSYSSHPECLAFYAGDRVTIRNSRFNNCQTFGIFISGDDVPIADTLIENNFFSNTGKVTLSAHIKTRSNGRCSNMLFRFNTFVDKNIISECPGANIRWESNIFTNGGCGAVGSFDYNVSLSGKCGPHDLVVSDLGLVDRNGLDFHLRADSPARGRGNASNAPAADIDGDQRPNPAGSPPDAGADERQ